MMIEAIRFLVSYTVTVIYIVQHIYTIPLSKLLKVRGPLC